MKRSIRFQFYDAVYRDAGALVLLAIWVISFFLEQYYINDKVKISGCL